MKSILGLSKFKSIDFEPFVTKKINERETSISYKLMDMINKKEIMDGEVDYVIEIGTLDALCSDNSAET